jgi:hypothetical protein
MEKKAYMEFSDLSGTQRHPINCMDFSESGHSTRIDFFIDKTSES